MTKYRRTIRRAFSSTRRDKKPLTVERVFMVLTVLAAITFVMTQLITNAILSPLGQQLQSLNNEKDSLVEQNRALEKQLAKNTSLTSIKIYSEKEFDLKPNNKKETFFVSTPSIQAAR
ncbi:hypothetical protein KC622_03170 [Candidatus Dojkabacteria bacterium]|uniref:Cell division protein FtsL n=1 Tax=Candidatus Dojkabacteria bacterium TaxID=2099670 RepID=A0A955KWN1_9BACT|nr:hypothetical protein [Candidatus Dojkabacteria bacterium]MCB9790742.1 hypothetical protein [Candidatus Nomurabacteria bacterium]